MSDRLVQSSLLIPLAAAVCAAFAGTNVQAAEYADVVSATPVATAVSVPRRVCRDEQQVVQHAPSGAGALIGAIAGGVLGHQIGGGIGQAVATGLGAVAGSAIGNQVEANNMPGAEVPVRRCQTLNRVESRVVGYDVMYDYAGQRYSTRMARDPGKRMAIEVRPAESGSDSLPVPAADGGANPVADASAWQEVPSAPQTVYYTQAPGYVVAPPTVYLSPFIGFGLGYYGGYYGGYHGGYYGGYRGHGRWH